MHPRGRFTLPVMSMRRAVTLLCLLSITLILFGSAPAILDAQTTAMPDRPRANWPPVPQLETLEQTAAAEGEAVLGTYPTPYPVSPIPALSNYSALTRTAYIQGTSSKAEIYIAQGDGSNRVRVTNNKDAEAEPVLSPDASRIAFHADYNKDEKIDIHVINSDGSGQLRLPLGGGSNYNPAWSHDGLSLLYTSDRDGQAEIYEYVLATNAERRITYDPAPDFSPTWHPNNKAMAWVRGVDAEHGVVLQMERHTGVITQLTPPILFLTRPFLSLRNKIAFSFIATEAEYGGPPTTAIGIIDPAEPQQSIRAFEVGDTNQDVYLEGWAPVADMPNAHVLIIGRHNYVRASGAWKLQSASISMLDLEVTRISFETPLWQGGVDAMPDTRGLDHTPPAAWTSPLPHNIAGLLPEDLKVIAWRGRDSTSNVRAFRFQNTWNDYTTDLVMERTDVVDENGYVQGINTCGMNHIRVAAVDWAGNWSPFSPVRSVYIGDWTQGRVMDVRGVSLPFALFEPGNSTLLPPDAATDGNGRFAAYDCIQNPTRFEKEGYVHAEGDVIETRDSSIAVMHTEPLHMDSYEWEWHAEGVRAGSGCSVEEKCPIPGMVLGRNPGDPLAQRTRSSLSTTVALTHTTPIHELTFNFFLAIRGLADTQNEVRMTVQAADDSAPTVVWKRRASNASAGNIWVDMDAWQGKVVTIVFELDTAAGSPMSLAVIGRPTLSSWLTPFPKTITYSTATSAQSGADVGAASIDATTSFTITGENFVMPVLVRIGDQPATVITATTTSIVAQISATVKQGQYNVIVTNPSGQGAALPGAFRVGMPTWLPVVRFD